MADDWEQYVVKDSKDDWEKYAEPVQPIKSNESSLANNAAMVGLGAAGAAGIGWAANKMIQPAARIERRNILKELNNMQAQAGIPGTEPAYLPKDLTLAQQQINVAKSNKVNNIRTQQDVAIKSLKNKIEAFDNSLLNTQVSDLSEHIKTQAPEFFKSASKNYADGLNTIDGMFKEADYRFSNTDIEKNVVGKALDTAKAQGIPDDELKPLMKAIDSLQGQSKLLNSKGKPLTSEMSFSNAKQVISNAMKDDPFSPSSSILRETWGQYLEKNSPPKAAEYLRSLNKSFQTFAQAREALKKIANPKTGEFDTKALNKYFQDYAKKNIDNGTENLMNLLSGKTPSVASPMDMGKFSELQGMAGVRKEQIGKLRGMQLDTPEKINAVKQQAGQEIEKILQWRKKASELNSRLNVLNDKIPSLNPVTVAGKVAGKIMRGGLRVLGPVGMVAQAGQLADNPGEALRSMMFLPTKGEMLQKLDEAVRSGKMNQKDADIQRFIMDGGI